MDSDLQPDLQPDLHGDEAAIPGVIPGELTGPLPRKTRASRRAVYTTAAAAVFLAFAVAYGVWVGVDVARQMQQTDALRGSSAEATGEITRLSSGRGKTDATVRYSFSVGDRSYTGKARVPGEFWDGLRQPGSLPIRYLPGDPAVNHPADWEWSALQDWTSLAAPVMGAGMALLLLLPLGRERRLVAEGVATDALVTKCARNSGAGFTVRYRFRGEDGAVTEGSGWHGSALDTGASVCILYLRGEPARNQPYPGEHYRVSE